MREQSLIFPQCTPGVYHQRQPSVSNVHEKAPWACWPLQTWKPEIVTLVSVYEHKLADNKTSLCPCPELISFPKCVSVHVADPSIGCHPLEFDLMSRRLEGCVSFQKILVEIRCEGLLIVLNELLLVLKFVWCRWIYIRSLATFVHFLHSWPCAPFSNRANFFKYSVWREII